MSSSLPLASTSCCITPATPNKQYCKPLRLEAERWFQRWWVRRLNPNPQYFILIHVKIVRDFYFLTHTIIFLQFWGFTEWKNKCKTSKVHDAFVNTKKLWVEVWEPHYFVCGNGWDFKLHCKRTNTTFSEHCCLKVEQHKRYYVTLAKSWLGTIQWGPGTYDNQISGVCQLTKSLETALQKGNKGNSTLCTPWLPKDSCVLAVPRQEVGECLYH